MRATEVDLPIQTLSHGYEKPTNPTTGDVFWQAMERNIQRMNDHNHDGDTGGPQLASVTSDVLAANWGADLGGGTYRQLITMPNPMAFDTTRLEVRRSTGEVAYPDMVKVSASTFYIYTNAPTVSYVISYV
jgi:hypothetical protein